MLDDVTLIVRACGERTERIATRTLARLDAQSEVHVVREVPFTKALRTGFDIAIEAGREWTLCIDADVLATKRGVTSLLEDARHLPASVFEVQGLVFDKFFLITRPAGNHLFRTSLLPAALELIPPEGTSLRPETDTLTAMARRGYSWLQSRHVVGAHDFEQHYVDIYRKCFLQAHKHREFLAVPTSLWSALERHDADFSVARTGVRDGSEYAGPIRVGADFRRDEAVDAVRKLGLTEKPAILHDVDPFADAQSLLASVPPDLRERLRRFESEMHRIFFPPPPTRRRRRPALRALRRARSALSRFRQRRLPLPWRIPWHRRR